MNTAAPSVDTDALATLIAEAKSSGGSEIANTQPFIERWCKAMGLEPPHLSNSLNAQNDYVFERRIIFKHPDGSTSNGRIDLYKRGAFVLESKQSSIALARANHDQLSFLPEDAAQVKQGTARRGTGGWDRAMLAARNQAESYARALPVEHGYPPFLLVLDVGHVLEIYADFSGQGKNYAHFPDRQTYRLTMDDLLLPDVQERLRAIWTDAPSLDPAKRSAEVTRDIAGRLSLIAKRLEGKHDPKEVAEFLMRCLFTMFAEDVGLLPDAGFAELLKELSNRPETFPVALESLWKTMDEGGYEPRLMTTLKRFNGSLFKSRRALPLAAEDIHELYVAAMQDWSDVEPAIFGTLLERALDPRERSKLGAHYTPRAYVERLVIPTIIEPLRADWDEVQAHVVDLKREGKDAEALQVAKDFHHNLCTTRVLDPACGSGNFLYVSLELMKKLEGEVLETLNALGEDQGRLAMEGETVGPRQFFGLEVNARAVPIADLVLWIGFLKWQLRTVGLSQITEPVLHAYGTIKQQDAILAYDRMELMRDESGKPVTRWDRVSVKLHPVVDKLVPNPEKRMEVYHYTNPRPAKWPEAEFIVGNPPFISSREMRFELSEGYVEAVFAAYGNVPKNVDFVMYFWWLALRTSAKRVGLVSTSRLRMPQNNAVFSDSLTKSKRWISFAVPDHKWPDGNDAASVRICMVTATGDDPSLARLVITPDKDQTRSRPFTDAEYWERTTVKTVDQIGPELDASLIAGDLRKLKAGQGISSAGVKPYSLGFLVDDGHPESSVVRPYANGAMIGQARGFASIVDVNHLEERDLRARYPLAYQFLLTHVRPGRETERNARLRLEWWRYEANRQEMRDALNELPSYFATLENSPRRYFVQLPKEVLPDQKLRVVASADMAHFSVLSSRIHEKFAVAVGGRAGKANTPVYNSRCFDAFPFPVQSEATHRLLKAEGERLHSFREERLRTHGFLNLTSLYNVMERLRELENDAPVEPLTDKERGIHEAGLVSVLKVIHDDIDRAVFEAYGWGDLIPALVGKPGATTPSAHKLSAQEAAEEELLTRLVSLNRERAAEEARGLVRWLRPEYQIPRLGKKAAMPEGEQLDVGVAAVAKAQRPKWPADAFEQIKLVRDVLAKAPAPMPVDDIAVAFDGRLTDKRRERIRQVLGTLVATGATHMAGAAFFVPR